MMSFRMCSRTFITTPRLSSYHSNHIKLLWTLLDAQEMLFLRLIIHFQGTVTVTGCHVTVNSCSIVMEAILWLCSAYMHPLTFPLATQLLHISFLYCRTADGSGRGGTVPGKVPTTAGKCRVHISAFTHTPSGIHTHE